MNETTKKPHVSGHYGVGLIALSRLRVTVWMREVLRHAGCPEQDFRRSFTQDEAKELLSNLPGLSKGKATQIPEGAQLALYLAGEREPEKSTVEAIADSRPIGKSGQRPFAYTDEVFLVGPGGFELWAALEGELEACKRVVTGELKIALNANEAFRQRFASAGIESVMRWGFAHGKRVSAFRQLLTGLDDDVRYTVPDMREMAGKRSTHPVTAAFVDALQRAGEDAIDTWQSYFVTAIALWQLSEQSHDSRNEADFVLAGMLAGPVETLFPGYGIEIRDYIIDVVMTHIGRTIKSRAERWATFFDRCAPHQQ